MMPATAWQPEEARRLLDNGWQVLLFRDGLGQYSALAVRDDASVDDAVAGWSDHETDYEAVSIPESVYDGPNRYCGCGLSVSEALHSVAEKVIFRRLPTIPPAG